jgi:heat-inducible transcriptional repressor
MFPAGFPVRDQGGFRALFRGIEQDHLRGTMELTSRERTVLGCVVELYISSGSPVASREIVRCSGLGLSSASIRNVVSRLESRGLLTRPHTSAGSVPSDQAFRLYVDGLGPRKVPATVKRRLEEQIGQMRRELVEDLEWVAKVAADATLEAGVAMRPIGEEPVVEAISMVSLGGDRVLGVIVTSDGTVEKRVVARDDSPRAEDLQQESNLLTRRFRGASAVEIRRRLRDSQWDQEPAGSLIRRSVETARVLFAEGDDSVELQLAGTNHLLQSEDFVEAERVRSLFSTLHNREQIASEWRRAFDRGPTQVIIGRESEVTASGNLGMVATLYYKEGRRAGALGVVGPRRMDYGRIVPVVEFIGGALTRMLEEPGAMHA